VNATTTACPDPGRIRAWRDGEADVDPGHIASCETCRAIDAEQRAAAALAARSLALLDPPGDVFSRKLRAPIPVAVPAVVAVSPSRRGRWQLALGGLAAMLLLAVVAVSEQGQALAGQFLAQFRGQRLAIVGFDSSRLQQPLGAVEKLGNWRGQPPQARSRVVDTIGEASTIAGFPVKQVEQRALPAGFGSSPTISVVAAGEMRFTFDRDRARAYFQSVGRPDLQLPERIHGATLVAATPAMAVQVFRAAEHQPALTIAQAGELAVGVEGAATLDEIRQFLLGVPGLPTDAINQLRALPDWRTTLPIPVAIDRLNWRSVSVGAAQGFLFEDRSGLGSALLWKDGPRVYGVVAPGKGVDVRRIADGLR
jgi:hypothetical protein